MQSVVNKTRAVDPATRDRVLTAIAETGFVVNSLARALAGASTATIDWPCRPSPTIGHGHRRIAMVSVVLGAQTNVERVSAYRRALRAHHLRFDPQLVVAGNSNADDAGAAVDQLLALAPRPATTT